MKIFTLSIFLIFSFLSQLFAQKLKNITIISKGKDVVEKFTVFKDSTNVKQGEYQMLFIGRVITDGIYENGKRRSKVAI